MLHGASRTMVRLATGVVSYATNLVVIGTHTLPTPVDGLIESE